jgi:hypothetical protein
MTMSPSLLVTIVAIATTIGCSHSFVTPKVSNICGRGAKSNHHRSCNIFSSTTTQQQQALWRTPSSLYQTAAPSDNFPLATDGEALQALFSNYSDDDGLMTKDKLMSVPYIKDMLDQEDLYPSELDEIWDAAPKFPEDVDRIDVDSFIQVYRDIDDMFEDEDGEEEEETVAAAVSDSFAAANIGASSGGDDDTELSQAFDALKDGDSSTISFSQLRNWEEITSLLNEGMLGEDEYKSLWEASGKGDDMDLERFLSFNAALDDLFVFDDDDDEEDGDEVDETDVSKEEDEEVAEEVKQQVPMITETDLPPAVLFSQLANENYLVGRTELQRWGEVQEMIADGELSQQEFDVLYDRVEKAPGTDMYLDEEGFCALVESIDDLFEDMAEEDTNEESQQPKADIRELKEELLELLEDLDRIGEEEGRQLCGLDCTELEQERVLEVVGELEREPYNKVVTVSASGGGAVGKEELVGDWQLMYSSSSTMKYNEGLSGLAGGLTRFGGLQQKIIGSKYLSDVEYTEQVIGKLGGKSFDVKISGDWDLKTEVSLFTGKPANVLSVTPDKVSYGPRSDKADHWKSLGPMNMLLLTYLDEDLRIMRGNTSTDTLFIWKRII